MKILSPKVLPPVKVALALGSNAADAERIFREACRLLEAGSLHIVRRSQTIRTKPVDCPPETPDFQNAALIGEWGGEPEELLDLTQSVEVAMGRPKNHGYHTARALDLDIILCGDAVLQTPRLTIPHPAAQKREFVLIPLSEIAPDWHFPDTGKTVKEALEGKRG